MFRLLSLFISTVFNYTVHMVSFWVKVLVILLLSISLMLTPTIIAVAIAYQYYEGKKGLQLV